LSKTAIILAGGFAKRFGSDKGILKIANIPLINHVVKKVESLVNEILIVTNSKKKIDLYSKELSGIEVDFYLDINEEIGPLGGALTGLKHSKGNYSLIIPFDTPFLSKKILSLLFDLCKNRSAVIPRWPNGHIEPLHSVYNTKEAFIAALDSVNKNEKKVRSIIQKLQNVFYISTEILQSFDPKLLTFFNINTPSDLEVAKKEYRKLIMI
jgi:molybdopterin-guanine dinucleotide biosynthesis protein A